MTADDKQPDFSMWAKTWQEDAPPSASAQQIRDYVTKRARLLRLFRFVDLAIGAVALPVIGYLAWFADNDVERISMIGLGSVVVAAIAFGWWNWSAALHAAARSTADYVTVSAEHLRRMRLAWRLGWVILAAEVVVFVIWIRNRLYGAGGAVDPFAERFAWLWLAGFTAIAIVSLIWFGRWLSRDSARLERLRSELDADDQLTAASTSVGANTRIKSGGARAIKNPRRPPLT